jgi:hypothetical protein
MIKTLIEKLKALRIYSVINSFFSELFCLHDWGETISGGIHYSYSNCKKCGKQQNISKWD